MLHYDRMSIWEDDPNQMSWYDYTVKDTRSQHLHTDSMNNNNIFKSNAAETAPSKWETDHAWYYELIAQDEEDERNEAALRNDIARTPVQQVDAKASSSLPSAPKRPAKQDPYFEYMFADAGLGDCAETPSRSTFYEDDAMTGLEEHDGDAPTPIEFCPATPPQVVEIMPAFVVQDHSADILTCHSDHPFDISEQQSPVAHQALLPMMQVVPNPFTQCTPETAQLPVSLGNRLLTPILDFSIPEPHEGSASEDESEHIRQILAPKSQKAKAARTWMSAALSLGGPMVFGQSRDATKAPDTDNIKVNKKRVARASVPLEQQFEVKDQYDYKNCKKARTSRNLQLEGIEAAFLTAPPSAFTNGRNTLCSFSDDFFTDQRLPVAPKGYAGQFEGMLIDKDDRAVFSFQPHRSQSKIHNRQVFGDKLSPNGVFTHSYFRADEVAEAPDYTERQLPSHHPLRACMSFATNMTIASCDPNIVALRTPDEQRFRRAAHVECTAARLEGVAVGFFRYLRGHYSIAEYHQAEMCICWDLCQCSKMCTRYGDMKCPCAGDITVHNRN